MKIPLSRIKDSPFIILMVIKRILLSIYFGFSAAMFFSLLFGTGGIVQFFQLQEYHASLEKNLMELQSIHHELTIDLRDLSSNPDTIRQKARQLGYYDSDEHVIRIQGMPAQKNTKQIGSLLKRNNSTKAPNPTFHLIGLAVALGAFMLSSYFKKTRAI